MKKKIAYKIQEAIKMGDLIPHEQVWKTFSREEQEDIMQWARYLKAAMELRVLQKLLGRI